MQYTIVIPAYNEAAMLQQTLPATVQAMTMVAQQGHHGELIVVDNNSSDDTAEVARSFDAQVVFEPVNQIAKARNAGAAAAQGDALIFVDADTWISGELVLAALTHLMDDTCGGGGAAITMDPPPPNKSWSLVIGFFNRVASLMGMAAGCFQYCRRSDFQAVGGYPTRVYAGEDVMLARKLRRHARRHKPRRKLRLIHDPPVVTSGRKFDNPWHLPRLILFIIFAPITIHFRSLCGIWYRRTDTHDAGVRNATAKR